MHACHFILSNRKQVEVPFCHRTYRWGVAEITNLLRLCDWSVLQTRSGLLPPVAGLCSAWLTARTEYRRHFSDVWHTSLVSFILCFTIKQLAFCTLNQSDCGLKIKNWLYDYMDRYMDWRPVQNITGFLRYPTCEKYLINDLTSQTPYHAVERVISLLNIFCL